MSAILYIFSGLPGSGKTTLAKLLSREIAATHLRIDTIEQGLKDLCKLNNIEGEGYYLAHRLASDNLKLGNSVIADSVNPWPLTRNDWNKVAIDLDVEYINIEISCSSKVEHKKRVESRKSDIENLSLPTWERVENRDYRPWKQDRIEVDTAGLSIEQSFSLLKEKLKI